MERWFDTGLLMEDGSTSISVSAKNDIQAAEYRKNGWKPLIKIEDLKKKAKGGKNEGRE